MFAFLLLPVAATAQPRFGAAVKFGVPFQGWFSGEGGREFSLDRSRPWSAGASAEVRLTQAFSIEASGMYQRVGLDSSGGYVPFFDRERGYGWELPIVARFRLPVRFGGFRPFVEAGPSIHVLHTHTDSGRATWTPGSSFGGLPWVTSTSKETDWTGGGTLGGGIEKQVGPARVAVDVRYTRWPDDGGYGGYGSLRRKQPNQGVVEFSFGF